MPTLSPIRLPPPGPPNDRLLADLRQWTPPVRVRSGGPVRRIVLPVTPARCDDHASLEAAEAIEFARRSCGLDG